MKIYQFKQMLPILVLSDILHLHLYLVISRKLFIFVELQISELIVCDSDALFGTDGLIKHRAVSKLAVPAKIKCG